MSSWENKVVLVTGGGAGIGRAAALRFVEAGERVVVTGRRSESLERLASGRDNIRFVVADAAAVGDAPRTVNQVVEHWGCTITQD